jgi:hypothetical protein
MSQTDINFLVETLNSAIKSQDWDAVQEAIEYLQDFQDDPQYEEE